MDDKFIQLMKDYHRQQLGINLPDNSVQPTQPQQPLQIKPLPTPESQIPTPPFYAPIDTTGMITEKNINQEVENIIGGIGKNTLDKGQSVAYQRPIMWYQSPDIEKANAENQQIGKVNTQMYENVLNNLRLKQGQDLSNYSTLTGAMTGGQGGMQGGILPQASYSMPVYKEAAEAPKPQKMDVSIAQENKQFAPNPPGPEPPTVDLYFKASPGIPSELKKQNASYNSNKSIMEDILEATTDSIEDAYGNFKQAVGPNIDLDNGSFKAIKAEINPDKTLNKVGYVNAQGFKGAVASSIDAINRTMNNIFAVDDLGNRYYNDGQGNWRPFDYGVNPKNGQYYATPNKEWNTTIGAAFDRAFAPGSQITKALGVKAAQQLKDLGIIMFKGRIMPSSYGGTKLQSVGYYEPDPNDPKVHIKSGKGQGYLQNYADKLNEILIDLMPQLGKKANMRKDLNKSYNDNDVEMWARQWLGTTGFSFQGTGDERWKTAIPQTPKNAKSPRTGYPNQPKKLWQ